MSSTELVGNAQDGADLKLRSGRAGPGPRRALVTGCPGPRAWGAGGRGAVAGELLERAWRRDAWSNGGAAAGAEEDAGELGSVAVHQVELVYVAGEDLERELGA
ncbi:hypothetical protein WME77_34570 [Sorangium sp. So ce764]|uniref:hypothetical protein n=1 Tax=Sorangium sp. So ce764 TaxID=3133320 RepID=UPI003F5FA86A